ncbi:hypothetical protein JHK85_031516 [Glycine max]|uniref:Uncharacterized protein n=2 Tax=Glycine subgen. Soja TaxID=1462606 RepID=K7LPK3_SOYBN|nr:hypothetical protein JHK85_031516 [Glycine max]KAH1158974.1 hypothetical protein GYH30_030933 [Glycine max]RZB79752.1 hypothetical protein D0Y65_029825 [Glycine soja]
MSSLFTLFNQDYPNSKLKRIHLFIAYKCTYICGEIDRGRASDQILTFSFSKTSTIKSKFYYIKGSLFVNFFKIIFSQCNEENGIQHQ